MGMTRGWLGLAVAAVGMAGAVLAGGCTVNPTTGRSQFAALSRSQEISLGTQAKPELTAEFGGAVTDPQLAGYVTEIGQKLARVTETDNPGLPWEFTLLNSEVINAFALPGGKVFISRGLADRMTSEAQLAGVLGHEIGHVTARHTSERIGQSTIAQVLVAGAAIGVSAAVKDEVVAEGAGVGLTVGGQLVTLKFSRDQESEADALGMRYMAKVGYDPRGQLEVMQILKEASGGGEGGATAEMFATHPLPETRIARVNELLRTTFANTQNNPAYQKREAEFRQRYLRRSAMLPPPPDREAVRAALLELGNPATWCAHCAEAAAEGRPVAVGEIGPDWLW